MQSLIKLPKSALHIFSFPSRRSSLPPWVISRATEFLLRTVTIELDLLGDSELCEKIPNLRDLKRGFYAINNQKERNVISGHGMVVS
ncbi:MAG: hypothetical protein ACFFEE_01115 [Candidatus Thorarchaeota archaeon]